MFYKLGDVLADVTLPKEWEFWFICNRWSDIVSSFVSDCLRPVRIRNGILYLAVENSCRLNDMFYLKDKIVDKVNSNLKNLKIKDIKYILAAD